MNLTRRTRSKRALWFAGTGGFLVLWSIADQTGYYAELFNLGIFLMIIGFGLLALAKPSYAVQIGSAAGTRSILRSTDPGFVRRIVDAMNRALAPG